MKRRRNGVRMAMIVVLDLSSAEPMRGPKRGGNMRKRMNLEEWLEFSR